MAKKQVDVFGFDELEKSFNRCQKKYPNAADAFLMAEGQAVNKKVKTRTPVHKGAYPPSKNRTPGHLKKSWRLKKVKLYKGGKVRVVREQSTDNVAHLVESGHESVRGGKTRVKGKKLNAVQRSVRGIKSSGQVAGAHMLETTITEAQTEFRRGAQKVLDKITEDIRA